jgi:gamma-glutamylcyclotransferase (GGCT)/AIG2-like uncharacterized protein YtfP
MHNGTISALQDMPDGVSDSRWFRDTIVEHLPGDFLLSNSMYAMVKSLLSGDRALFMDGDGGYSIINGSSGVWEYLPKNADKDSDNGVWFSHRRNREYFMTGKEPKPKYFGGGGGNYYQSTWYDITPTDNRATKKSVKSVVSHNYSDRCRNISERPKANISLDLAEKDGSLIFVYGLLRDDIDGSPYIKKWDATYVGLGELTQHGLYSIDDKSYPLYGRPGAMRVEGESSIHGYVLNIRGGVKNRLDAIDDSMGVGGSDPLYYRTKVMVKINRQGKREWRACHIYLATPLPQFNEISSHVVLGDWEEWCHAVDNAVSKDSDSDEDAKVYPISKFIHSELGLLLEDDIVYTSYDDDGSTTCLVCWNQNQQYHYSDKYWCNICMDEFPAQMTDKEIEDALDALTK